MLAVRIMQRQGFELEALYIQTIFECCKVPAASAAAALGVRLTISPVGDDYLEIIRHPKYGRGKGANPCIDCRIYMCRMARRLMETVGACVVVTGEVVGQRPMSQQRWQQHLIEKHSGLKGRLLRPLSAKLLPPTIPELEGLVDRNQLYDFRGRSRKPLIALAKELGICTIPQPSTGCALAQVSFAPRVLELLETRPEAARWEFELLRIGRHQKIDERTKVIIGKNARDNTTIEAAFRQHRPADAAYLHPENFLGPDVLVVGRIDADTINQAGYLLLQFTKRFDPEQSVIRIEYSGGEVLRPVKSMLGAAAPGPI